MIHITSQPSIAQPANRLSSRLFALGLGAGFLNLLISLRSLPFGDGFEMVTLATNLAHHGAYANPFYILPTGPSAYNPPLYPFFLALLIKFLPGTLLVALAASLGSLIANAFTAVLLPRASALLLGDPRPGIAAAILWLISAPLMPAWDVSYTVALLLFFCLFTAESVEKKRLLLHGGLAGLLAAALFLLNPSSLLVFAPWIAYHCLFPRAGRKRTFLYFLIVFLFASLAISPWIWRNHRQLGAFTVRTNFGISLLTSNNDCASSSLIADQQSGCNAIYNPDFSLPKARMLRDLGEVKYDRLCAANAKAWIQTHPTLFFRLTLARVRDFWFPSRQDHPFSNGLICLVTLLSIPGLIRMVYRREKAVLFILFVLLLYPLMYYLVLSDLRYRYPVLWLSLLPAGNFLLWLIQMGQEKRAALQG
jgi:hypothetical protein